MQEVYDFLKAAETYFLATVDGDQPHVRPFGTYVIFEDRLYIQTGKIKDVSKQISANPKIGICALKDDKWLRITAEAVNDDRVEAKRYILDEYPQLKDRYSAEDGNTQVLYLKNATATFSTFTGVIKVMEF